MDLLQPMTIALLAVVGMGIGLWGCIKRSLAGSLDLGEARLGTLLALFGLVTIPVMLSMDEATKANGPRTMLLAGSALFSVGLVMLSCSRCYVLALPSVLVLSSSWACLSFLSLRLLPAAFPDGPPGSKNVAVHLGQFLIGLGAFLTTVGVAVLTWRTSLSRTLRILAVVAWIPAILSLGVDFDASTSTIVAHARPAKSIADLRLEVVLTDPIFWLCAFAAFFYFPLEACLSYWTASYFRSKGASEQLAAGLLPLFWFGLTLSRSAILLGLPVGFASLLILGLSLAVIAVIAGLVVCQAAEGAIGLVLLVGLLLGPVLPILLSLFLGHHDRDLQGQAAGVLLAVGGLGWTIFPLVQGIYAHQTRVQRSFAIPLLAAMGLGVGSVLVATSL
jgi:fucose permease